jgi:hypothetical protein
MDILRDQSQLSFIIWIITSLLWTIGGYFLAFRIFKLLPGENLIAGFGVGLSVYIFLSNITARFFDPMIGFSLPAILIFGAGFLAVRRNIPNPFHEKQRSQIILIILGFAFTIFFFMISRGVSLYDDYRNLPIISQMGRGIIPPTYESMATMGNHYGFQLYSASLMALGGFFPWSAFDLSKAIVWGYTIILVYLIAKRYLVTWWKSAIAAGLFVFAGGTRYLLLLLPPAWNNRLDALINLRGTSSSMDAPFSLALRLPWTLDGGPPGSYLFGFMNGIYPNYVLAHAGTGTLSLTFFMLFWILIQKERSKWSAAIYTIIFSSWALTWESSYGLFGLGMGITAIWLLIAKRAQFKDFFQKVLLPGILSLPIVFFQGGVVTDRLGTFLIPGASNTVVPSDPNGFMGFWFRIPPQIQSSHLGNLTLTEPLMFLVVIAELGLVVLFFPWITHYLLKRFQTGETVPAIILFSSWLGLFLPCFIGFTLDRDITRLSEYSIGLWITILSIDILSMKKWNTYRVLGIFALGVMSIGGISNLLRELPAISKPVDSYYVNELDVKVSNEYWGKLPKNCKIFDPGGFTALIVTGCKTEMTYRNTYTKLPEWKDLANDPSPRKLYAAGYDFAYLDLEDWIGLSPETKAEYKSPCTNLLSKELSEFHARRLYQLVNCK